MRQCNARSNVRPHVILIAAKDLVFVSRFFASLRMTTGALVAKPAMLVFLLLLVGCSSDSRIAASGTVTLDGKPLESGAVSFRPAPGNTSNSSGGQIERGQFHLTANHGLCPGKYLVTVQAFKPTGRMVKDQQLGKDVPEQASLKFNEVGKLEAVVAAGAENNFDFHLTSADVAR